MALFGCGPRCTCSLAAVLASAAIGIITAFLQITAAITITTPFLWAVLGVALVYLAVLLATAAFTQCTKGCACTALNTVLTGILGTVFFGIVLLAFGIIATSVVSAVLVGLLAASFSLIVTGSACFVKGCARCGE